MFFSLPIIAVCLALTSGAAIHRSVDRPDIPSPTLAQRKSVKDYTQTAHHTITTSDNTTVSVAITVNGTITDNGKRASGEEDPHSSGTQSQDDNSFVTINVTGENNTVDTEVYNDTK